MLRDVWQLVTAAEMRALDRHTIETFGVPGELLMELAGCAVVAEVLALRSADAAVLVCCGPGNNGGDGYVVARHLALLGVPVRVLAVGEPRPDGDAAANRRRALAVGVVPATADFDPGPGGVVVDALFGTGLARALEGAAADALRAIGTLAERCGVVSVDVPSGLDADTGQPTGPCVQADVTVTLGLPKLGLALEPGRSLAGRIRVARIGIADEAPGLPLGATLYTRAAVARALPPRPRHGHKGSFGHVLVAAGSQGKTGAAALAALGAARVGAGLVTIACPQRTNPVLEAKCTEAMTAPLPETADGGFGLAAQKPLLELAEGRTAAVLGPGIGRTEETLEWARRSALALPIPLVLDADGLIAFAADPALLAAREAPTIVTPHPGEAAALLGASPAEVNADRPSAARRLAQATGAVVLLKGAATVMAKDGLHIVINPTGGPLLASGGTGDVLAGAVGGLLAQGVPADRAAALGAYLHGLAADRLRVRLGDAGALAGEIADALPGVVHELRTDAGPPRLGDSDVLAFPEP